MEVADQRLVEALKIAAKSGKFGKNSSFVSLVPTIVQGEDHFASEVVFATVKLKNSSARASFKVVIKKQQREALVRDMMNTDLQFYVEVVMYNEILPFLEANGIVEDTFPMYIYGNATLGEDYTKDILVVEDLSQLGYELSKERVFLDFDHCALALRKLGRFHALSYLAKQQNCKGFFSHIKKLKEVRWVSHQKEQCNQILRGSVERGFQQLLKEEARRIPLKFIEKTQDPHEYMKELCHPEEPIAVLCHGDFCRNNMIFKYESGKPVDVRFFDVAAARYASPGIDLSFFLSMNTSAELRRFRWDDLLDSYYEGLCTVAASCEVPSLATIHSEVAAKAPYGYLLSSYFLPVMIDENRPNIEDLTGTKPGINEEVTTNHGGEQGTRLITDILRDLIKLTC